MALLQEAFRKFERWGISMNSGRDLASSAYGFGRRFTALGSCRSRIKFGRISGATGWVNFNIC